MEGCFPNGDQREKGHILLCERQQFTKPPKLQIESNPVEEILDAESRMNWILVQF